MRKIEWKTLLFICLLLPVAGLADDSIEELYDYQSRWRLTHLTETPTFADSFTHTSNSLDFDITDGSSILRVTRIRSLSLLTLAGDDRRKWFLGINEDGIVGIHFRGFTRNGVKRHLDVSSLFSSKKDEPANDVY